jgi:hypothetical protein
MSFPGTRKAMEAAGYKRSTYTRCQACMAALEFWHTPQGRVIPMESMPLDDSPAITHFANCPEAKKFRKVRR